ncbi:hypothetical protein CDAR_277211 [Caerostris darwini]|uniref:Uncharacterized protein n=1 Tax=Caerostris darwini TaxID=1538125 RepID=A0AAV4VEG2_9ARAC|nr:hypothetical protein CDAR_277211 [Caerostris darwini]
MGKSKGTCYPKAAKLNSKSQCTGKTDSSEDSYPLSVFPASLQGIYSSNAGNGNHELQSRTIRKQEGKGGFPLPFISVLLGVGKVHGGDEDQECAGEKRCMKRGTVCCADDHSNEWEGVCKGDLIYLSSGLRAKVDSSITHILSKEYQCQLAC